MSTLDKYEYKIRAEEIKSLIANGEFAEAVKIADTIDWHRVKSVMMLCTISDLYKINRRFQESKDILLMAYERHPGGRLIVYSLCELSIKMGEFVQAIEYYKEFVQIAPKDTGRYILQYKLYEAQDVSLEERIAVLEEFKKRDYREKWAYELAYLYHRVGLETKCVEECDEMILWFGEGRYVLKALELKQLHKPLSESQQEKYLQIKQAMEEPPEEEQEETVPEEIPELDEMEPGDEEAAPGDTGEEEMDPDGMDPEVGEEEAAFYQEPELYAEPELYTDPNLYADPDFYGESDRYGEPEDEAAEYPAEEEVRPEEEFRVKTVDLGQYNTMNLQKELAESMREILGEDGNVRTGAFFGGQPAALTEDSFAVQEQQDAAAVALREPEYRRQEQPSEAVQPRRGQASPSAAVEEVFFEEDARDILQQDTKRIDFGDTKEILPGQKVIYQTALPARFALPQQGTPMYRPESLPYSEETPVLDGMQPGAPKQQAETVQAEIVQPETARPEPQQPETIQAHPNLMKTHKPSGFEQMLTQEYDGQISLVVPSNENVEKQITGQMNIADIMAEWERTKRANEEKRREDVRKRVQQHTGNMFSEFDEATKSGLLEQLEKAVVEAILKESGQSAVDPRDISEQRLDDIVKSIGRIKEAAAVPEEPEKGSLEDENIVNFEYMKTIAEMAGIDNRAEEPEEEADAGFPAEMMTEGELAQELSREGIFEDIFRPEQAEGLPEEEGHGRAGGYAADAEEPEETAAESTEDMEEAEDTAGQQAEDDSRGEHKTQSLTPEEKELFGRFIHSRKSKEQILYAVGTMSMDSGSGNVIVTGEEEAGTLDLARNLVRMLQLVEQKFSGRVAKISGKTLNKKEVAATLDKLEDGALIIEHATGMASATAMDLKRVLEKGNRNIFIIMEGKRDEMNIFLHKNRFLLDNFNARIDIESLNDQALVEYAKQYAEEMEYSIDELGILALHTRIADMQTSDHEVTVAEVKDLVDDAIYFADKKNPKHFFDILFGKRYDAEDMIILREKDFMHY